MTNRKAMFLEMATLFTLGASIYCVLEVLWRGYTHWSMAVAGGVSLCALGRCRDRLRKRSLLLRCVAGAGIITAVEFLTGCVVNLWLGWSVWDYSHHKLNILGQVCPQFFLIWLLLCLPGYAICRVVRDIREMMQYDMPSDAV